MTRISLSGPVGSDKFTPVSKVYDRTTKDGAVPVVNYLVGAHYNVNVSGILNVTSSGATIANDTLGIASSKLEIAARTTNAATTVTKTGTFSSFMYWFPKTKMEGNLELAVGTVSGSPLPTHSITYTFQDIATNDALIVEYKAGASYPTLSFKETVAGATST